MGAAERPPADGAAAPGLFARGRSYYASTHGDQNSRLWLDRPRADFRLTCGSLGARAALTQSLWTDGTLAGLSDAGLLHSFRPAASAPYPFALRMTAEPVLLAPGEWCGAMWRAAAASILRLLAELSRRGLTLASARPEFMLLSGSCQPLYARPGAIVTASPEALQRSLHQAAECFLLPLYLCATGRSAALRALLVGGGPMAPQLAFPELADAARLACDDAGAALEPAFFTALADQAAAQEIPMPETFWSRYYQTDLPLGQAETWPYKNQAVERTLAATSPATVLDLACNTGWYARLAASRGARVVALDADEACVNRLFNAAAGGGLPIVPAVADLYWPATLPSLLPGQSLPAGKRFSSDLVLALAITHHMVLSPARMSFAAVAQLLGRYADRRLLTEFVSFEPESHNPYRPADRPDCVPWYTLENFLSALRRRFRDVVLVPGPPGRRLVLAER